VLAAYGVRRAFVDLSLVDSFRWHSQATLSALFFGRFATARDDQDRAQAEWRAVTDCPLLVIDDLFAQALTPAFGEALATLIRERLDHMRPMILTSNRRPQWAVHFEHDVGRLDSRWRGYGVELVVTGVDLRRAA
jgi:DNA replication protein DnaC